MENDQVPGTDEARQWTGRTLPSVTLPATDGREIDLSALAGTTVVYAYPRTSPPDQPPIEGWDQIPGARGCTPQSRSFAATFDALKDAGVDHVFGLSTQNTDYQSEVVERLSLPFSILSDSNLAFAGAMSLPTFTAGGMTLLVRLTLVIAGGTVTKVFYPVEDPGQNADDVLRYVTSS